MKISLDDCTCTVVVDFLMYLQIWNKLLSKDVPTSRAVEDWNAMIRRLVCSRISSVSSLCSYQAASHAPAVWLHDLSYHKIMQSFGVSLSELQYTRDRKRSSVYTSIK